MENSTKVITGKVRFSYANVFEPTAMQDGQTPKYNVSIIISKSDTKTVEAIKRRLRQQKKLEKVKLLIKMAKFLLT